jgi:hypothetical protein
VLSYPSENRLSFIYVSYSCEVSLVIFIAYVSRDRLLGDKDSNRYFRSELANTPVVCIVLALPTRPQQSYLQHRTLWISRLATQKSLASDSDATTIPGDGIFNFLLDCEDETAPVIPMGGCPPRLRYLERIPFRYLPITVIFLLFLIPGIFHPRRWRPASLLYVDHRPASKHFHFNSNPPQSHPDWEGGRRPTSTLSSRLLRISGLKGSANIWRTSESWPHRLGCSALDSTASLDVSSVNKIDFDAPLPARLIATAFQHQIFIDRLGPLSVVCQENLARWINN